LFPIDRKFLRPSSICLLTFRTRHCVLMREPQPVAMSGRFPRGNFA
jgi:hypothetical protein